MNTEQLDQLKAQKENKISFKYGRYKANLVMKLYSETEDTWSTEVQIKEVLNDCQYHKTDIESSTGRDYTLVDIGTLAIGDKISFNSELDDDNVSTIININDNTITINKDIIKEGYIESLNNTGLYNLTLMIPDKGYYTMIVKSLTYGDESTKDFEVV